MKDTQTTSLVNMDNRHYRRYVYANPKREQEIRNLVWISECIVQRQRDEISKYVPLFSENASWKVARRGGGR